MTNLVEKWISLCLVHYLINCLLVPLNVYLAGLYKIRYSRFLSSAYTLKLQPIMGGFPGVFTDLLLAFIKACPGFRYF